MGLSLITQLWNVKFLSTIPPKGKSYWKENPKNKQEIQTKIDQINLKISNISLDDKQHLSDLIARLDLLKIELNKINDQETAGLIIRSRVKWAEHGEKSSRYFCNLEKRSNEKKNIHVVKNDTGSIISDQNSEGNPLFL